MISIRPLCGIGEVEPGADLAALLAPLLQPQPRDILVVTQKIVSKAENRFVSLADVNPGAEARRLAAITGKDARLVELVLADSTAILRAAPNVLIARHRSGHVMANAGIDQSNLGARHSGMALLLPEDADRSAAALRLALAAWCHPVPAIIIADSFGRPWRLGVVNIALGAAGLPALVDRRGHSDRDGRPLEVTQIAAADAIAAAAGLAMGEAAEGIPAALVRGVRLPAGELPASALIRPLGEDLFQ
jgi:coenzyme F420-0:L-glutamate ligase/coenzyme F420-1:gamma-L-glutamate ligase